MRKQKKWQGARRAGASVWEGDRRQTSVTIHPPGKPPECPDVALWADVGTSKILGYDALPADAPPEALADSLRRALSSNPRSRPGRIRVTRVELAEALRPVTEPLRIAVEVADAFAVLDQMYRHMELTIGSPMNARYLETTDISEPVLRDLFAAAAEFYRLHPWKSLTDHEPILLASEGWQPKWRYAVIMGASEQVFGMVLYESWRDLQTLYDLPEESAQVEELMMRMDSVTLIFHGEEELGPHRLAEAREHGWEMASPSAYPFLMASGRRHKVIWPSEEEVRMLITVVRALLPLLGEMSPEDWDAAYDHPVSRIQNVAVVDDVVDVGLVFPAMEARPLFPSSG